MYVCIKYAIIFYLEYFFLFRIYIPSRTWSFRLSVWNCSFTLRNLRDIRESCIDSMSLRGRALPIFNQSHSLKLQNLTMNTSYTFVESSPYEDSYYYLSIVSNSVIEFNIKIDILGNFYFIFLYNFVIFILVYAKKTKK